MYDVIIIGGGVSGAAAATRTFPLSGKGLRTGEGRGCVLRNIQSKQRNCACRLRCGDRISDGKIERTGK